MPRFSALAKHTIRLELAAGIASGIESFLQLPSVTGTTFVALPEQPPYLEELAAMLRRTEPLSTLAAVAHALNLSLALVDELAKSEPNKMAITDFYSKHESSVFGVMERNKGRKRSVVVVPAIHPAEYVSKFLLLTTGARLA